jgi:conjugative transposon TraM protein
MQTIQQRKAKFFLVLPVIVIPLMTLLFWKFGGGQAQAAYAKPRGGYNFELPEAKPDNQDNWTMLDYYKKADQDSAKRKSSFEKDPAFLINNDEEKQPEERVYRKLKELEDQVAASESNVQKRKVNKSVRPDIDHSSSNNKIERLERMMQHMEQPAEPDAELAELNAMLNKLAGLENPTDKTSAPTDSVNRFALPVSVTDESEIMPGTSDSDHFFGIVTEHAVRENAQQIIKVIIEDNQTVTSGSTVALKLIQPVKIGATIIPKHYRIYATAVIQQNRLQLSVKGILFEQQLLPVQLIAYDQTGTPGVVISNKVVKDFAQQTAQRSIGSIGFNNINPTVEGQIAEAGLQTAKSLFAKKTKVITISLRSGDEVWLIDQTSGK